MLLAHCPSDPNQAAIHDELTAVQASATFGGLVMLLGTEEHSLAMFSLEQMKATYKQNGAGDVFSHVVISTVNMSDLSCEGSLYPHIVSMESSREALFTLTFDQYKDVNDEGYGMCIDLKTGTTPWARN
jgi:hypothetical protein